MNVDISTHLNAKILLYCSDHIAVFLDTEAQMAMQEKEEEAKVLRFGSHIKANHTFKLDFRQVT